MTEENATSSNVAPSRRRRLLLIAALGGAAVVFGFLAFGDLGESLVYYWSPSELIEAGDRAHSATVRLGGLVAPDSVRQGADGLTLDFAVTDGQHSVPVHATAVPPAMFREGIGVVLEGHLRQDGVFESSRLLIKHDNEYRAPDEADERSLEELIETMQFDRTTT